jgi:hypothetical protein
LRQIMDGKLSTKRLPVQVLALHMRRVVILNAA